MIKIFSTISTFVILVLIIFTPPSKSYAFQNKICEKPLTLLDDGNRGELSTIQSIVVSGVAEQPETFLLSEGAATKGVLTINPDGAVNGREFTIVFSLAAGSATKVVTETAADNSGTAVEELLVTEGSALMLCAITRDESNNFIANVSQDDWSLENLTGGDTDGELIPSGDTKSIVFTSHISGTVTSRIFYLF
jgi:hypothetical protein